VAGESHNFGNEQAHLNNVEDAELHITGLKAAAGFGVEFLEYLHPTDGRSVPSDRRSDDLMSWQTTLVVENLGAIAQSLMENRVPLVSENVVPFPDATLGFHQALLVNDPDGHLIQLVQR
jgi:hypothetical protein